MAGVLHLSLRGCQPERITKELTSVTNLFGDQLPDEKIDFSFVKKIFRDSLQDSPSKPLVIVEDIHSVPYADSLAPPLYELVSFFLELHRAGLINVVYTVSDYQATNLLSKVSGHSSTLKVEHFPLIPDDVLAPQLAQLAIDKQIEDIIEDGKKNKLKYLLKFVTRSTANPDTNFVLRKDTEAEYIVQHLGCHMGQIVACLRGVLESGQTVEDAVAAVVKQGVGQLTGVFLGDIEIYYIAVCYILFEALSKVGVKQVHWDQAVREGAPRMTSNEITQAVAHLVRENLLSYMGPFHVCLHSRHLKWAYLDYVKKDSGVQIRCNEAVEKYSQ